MHSFIKRRSLEERFWEKVDKNGPIHPTLGQCWVWTGSVNARHYGQLWSHKNANGSQVADVVHRISYRMHKGEIPEGLFVDHMCRNKVCVNPDHLRAVTPTVNSRENSVSPFATNALKTHCKHGHEFTQANTRWITVPVRNRRREKTGTKRSRMCLACYARRIAEACAKYHAQKRSEHIQPVHGIQEN